MSEKLYFVINYICLFGVFVVFVFKNTVKYCYYKFQASASKPEGSDEGFVHHPFLGTSDIG